MALRSHIMRMLETEKTGRKMSYWYGARSLREMFYVDDFDRLQSENENFEWHVALSEPLPEDNWRATRLHPPGGPRELPPGPPAPRSASTTSAARR